MSKYNITVHRREKENRTEQQWCRSEILNKQIMYTIWSAQVWMQEKQNLWPHGSTPLVELKLIQHITHDNSDDRWSLVLRSVSSRTSCTSVQQSSAVLWMEGAASSTNRFWWSSSFISSISSMPSKASLLICRLQERLWSDALPNSPSPLRTFELLCEAPLPLFSENTCAGPQSCIKSPAKPKSSMVLCFLTSLRSLQGSNEVDFPFFNGSACLEELGFPGYSGNRKEKGVNN